MIKDRQKMSVQMFYFTDDITVIVENKEDLSNMQKKMNNALKGYHMKINKGKTKICDYRKQQIDANIVLEDIIL